jgi:hypothetical protein
MAYHGAAYDDDEDVVEYRLDGGVDSSQSQSQLPSPAPAPRGGLPARVAAQAPAPAAPAAPPALTPADVILRHMQLHHPRGGGGGGGGDAYDPLLSLADALHTARAPGAATGAGGALAARSESPHADAAASDLPPVANPVPPVIPAAAPPSKPTLSPPRPPQPPPPQRAAAEGAGPVAPPVSLKRRRREEEEEEEEFGEHVEPTAVVVGAAAADAAAAGAAAVGAAAALIRQHGGAPAAATAAPAGASRRGAPALQRSATVPRVAAAAAPLPPAARRPLPPPARRGGRGNDGNDADADDVDADVAALEAATPARPPLRPRSSSSRGPPAGGSSSSSSSSSARAGPLFQPLTAARSGGGGGGGLAASRGGVSRFMRAASLAPQPAEPPTPRDDDGQQQQPARPPRATVLLAPGFEVSQSLLNPEPASPRARRDAHYTSQVQSSPAPCASPAAAVAAAATTTAAAAGDGTDDANLASRSEYHETTMLALSDAVTSEARASVDKRSRKSGALPLSGIAVSASGDADLAASSQHTTRAQLGAAGVTRFGSAALRSEDMSNEASLLWRLTCVRRARVKDETVVAHADSAHARGRDAPLQDYDPRSTATALSIRVMQCADGGPPTGRHRLLFGAVDSSSEPGFAHGAAVRLLISARATVSAGQTVTLWSPFWSSESELVLPQCGQPSTKLLVAGSLFRVT